MWSVEEVKGDKQNPIGLGQIVLEKVGDRSGKKQIDGHVLGICRGRSQEFNRESRESNTSLNPTILPIYHPFLSLPVCGK
jgi:hypothetical protein